MSKQKQLTVRVNEDLYEMAKYKCHEQFGIGLSPLIKVFLKAFVSQGGVGFYIGDEDLCNLFRKWLIKKRMNKDKKGGSHIAGPFLKDLYDI
ncbi:hypothetical protein GF366_02005 [Candidatus Peregrinibacteria bacterium]|nr:hypothetical protein [Candidatus Peregrinibacteria bacterium]